METFLFLLRTVHPQVPIPSSLPRLVLVCGVGVLALGVAVAEAKTAFSERISLVYYVT
jgi:hypothetical protein